MQLTTTDVRHVAELAKLQLNDEHPMCFLYKMSCVKMSHRLLLRTRLLCPMHRIVMMASSEFELFLRA